MSQEGRSPRALSGDRARSHPDFGLAASRAPRRWISVVGSHPVGAALFRLCWEALARLRSPTVFAFEELRASSYPPADPVFDGFLLLDPTFPPAAKLAANPK